MFTGPTFHVMPGTGRHGESMRIRYRIPLCAVAQPASTSLTNAAIVINATASTSSAFTSQNVGTLALGPNYCGGLNIVGGPLVRQTACYFDSLFLAIMSTAFARYNLMSDMTLHYLPETTTATSVAFALGFVNDPMHPTLGVSAKAWPRAATSYGPTFANIKSASDSIVFAAWAPWSRRFPLDKSEDYFLYNPITIGDDYTTSQPFGYGTSPRWGWYGALSVMANSLSAGALTTFGQLYIEMDLEFSDFIPVGTSGSAPISLLTALRDLSGGRMEISSQPPRLVPVALERKVDPDDDPTPPIVTTPAHPLVDRSVPGYTLIEVAAGGVLQPQPSPSPATPALFSLKPLNESAATSVAAAPRVLDERLRSAPVSRAPAVPR
jgi:hypothetical protein